MTPSQEAAERMHVRRQLRALGLCFIGYGLLGLFGLGSLVALDRLVSEVMTMVGGDLPEVAAQIRALMPVLRLAVVLLVASHVLFHALVGIGLMRQRCYGACYWTAVLSLLSFPVGTVLGVLTLIALAQPEARRLFGRLPPAPA